MCISIFVCRFLRVCRFYDGVYVGVCAELLLYVDLYEDVEVYDGREE